MKTYYIYNTQTDEKIGTVEATNIDSAELKAIRKYNVDCYALTTDENEALA